MVHRKDHIIPENKSVDFIEEDVLQSTNDVLRFYSRYKHINPEKCVEFLSLALTESAGNPADKDRLELTYALAYCFFLLKQTDTSTEILTPILIYAEDHENEKLKANIYLLYALLKFHSRDYVVSLRYFFKSVDQGFVEVNASAFLYIGQIFLVQKQYEEALNYTLKAENLLRNLDNNFNTVNVLINLGTIYRLLDQVHRSIPHLEEAVRIVKDKNILTSLDDAYLQLAKCYLKMNDHASAMDYVLAGIEASNKTKDPEINFRLLTILADLMLQKSSYEKAKEALNKAGRIHSEGNLIDQEHIVHHLRLFQKLAKEKGDHEKALILAEQIDEMQDEMIKKAYTSSFKEILEDKSAELKMLEKKNQAIAQKNLELSQYSFVVAHDLKEPVRVINSFATLIKRRFADKYPEEIKEYLDYITDSAELMNSKLTNLLDYVEIDEKKQIESVDLNHLLAGLIEDTFRSEIDRNGYTIEVSDLPIVNANMQLMHQLFYHLIDNSIKYLDKDEPLRISIYSYFAKGVNNIMINDNGIGIEEKYHEHVFGLFKRLDKSVGKGTGIGLSICKKIVESLGGSIWIDSVLGNGTTIHFTIPDKT